MSKRIEELVLTFLGMCLIVLMTATVVQVICSAFDVNPIVVFERAYAVVGDEVTLNSLLDFQWHLLVVTGLLPAGLVWLTDRHVRVDFLYQHLTKSGQARINLLGNLVFAAPFFVLVLPAAWMFVQRAWSSDEGSRNAGLNDLWLIKSVLPLGLGLLAAAVIYETLRLVRHVR